MKKKNRIFIYPLVIMGVLLMLTSSCKKKDDNSNPVLTTAIVSNILQTTATCGGNITSDGGATVTVRGVCWSTGTTPTITDSKTTDGTGIGNFSSAITGLTANTAYYVRAYATNNTGTGYGSAIQFTTLQGTGTVTDIDGNVYNTVTIGTQIWMVENLKVTKYNNGTAIPLITDGAAWTSLTTPGYCWYNNDYTTYGSVYGALYNWHTVNTGNLCPIGWHVPTDAEWTTLTDYLGGLSIAGGKLKETGTSHWAIPNTGATNESGFTALPGGWRGYDGSFHDITYTGYWWSSTQNGSSAWERELYQGNATVSRNGSNSKFVGFSVRCKKD